LEPPEEGARRTKVTMSFRFKRVRIGTRGSKLALAQAQWVKAEIEKHSSETDAEIVVIKTTGDRFGEASLQAIGGKGLFTKEIEEALLRRDVDVAVHSMKDLPTELPGRLVIAAVPKRVESRDVLVSRDGIGLGDLRAGKRIGTGSLRRKAQLLHFRSDLSVVPVRGNVDTRLRKLDAGEVDALVMAAAGLKRIGEGSRITEYIGEEVCVSAVAQGALALESRDDEQTRLQLEFLHDTVTQLEVDAERAFLKRLGGGCQVPIGARARVEEDQLRIIGIVAHPAGNPFFRDECSGRREHGEALGAELAERLLRRGAENILTLPPAYR